MAKKIKVWVSEEIKDFLMHNNIDVPSLSVMRLTDKIGDLVDLRIKTIFDDIKKEYIYAKFNIRDYENTKEQGVKKEDIDKIEEKHLGGKL